MYSHPATIAAAAFFGLPPCNLSPLIGEDGQPTPIGHLYLGANQLGGAPSGSITVGFRPEGGTVLHGGAGSAPFVVERLEPMKPDTVVHLRAGETRIAVRSSTSVALEAGTRVTLEVAPSKWLAFDSKTGRRL